MMTETIVGIVGIVVTVISIIVTTISIIQSNRIHKHQKATAATKDELLFLISNY